MREGDQRIGPKGVMVGLLISDDLYWRRRRMRVQGSALGSASCKYDNGFGRTMSTGSSAWCWNGGVHVNLL